MDNEKFQELVLQQLQALQSQVSGLSEGQKFLKQGQQALQDDVTAIKSQLRYVWEDIKRIDKRLSNQEEEVVILKQLK
jgi:uncharacterized protein YoxC